MRRTKIQLDHELYQALTNIARREHLSLSEVVRQMLQEHLAVRQQQELASAAQALLVDYQSEPELTIFTALDAEDFHASRPNLAY